MKEYRLFPTDVQKHLIAEIHHRLPEGAEVALLSYTGSKAFGWGGKHHDWDVHGFFVKEDWFRKCHVDIIDDEGAFDVTITNIKRFDNPDIWYNRWKNYYDKSNPIFIHEDFDYHEFMGCCSYDTILNVFPYDINIQRARLDLQFTPRTALHTYKEILIPLYYIETGEIETDVVNVINDRYGYEGLQECADAYQAGEKDVDEESVRSEVDDAYDKLEDALVENTEYER